MHMLPHLQMQSTKNATQCWSIVRTAPPGPPPPPSPSPRLRPAAARRHRPLSPRGGLSTGAFVLFCMPAISPRSAAGAATVALTAMHLRLVLEMACSARAAARVPLKCGLGATRE